MCFLLFAFAITFSHGFYEDDHEHGVNCTHDHQDHPEPEMISVDEDYQIIEGDEPEYVIPEEGEGGEGDEQIEGRSLASKSYKNLRMYGYYTTLNSAPSGFRNYMRYELGPAVISYFQGALKVKYPVTSTIKLSSSYKTICGVKTPSLLRSGVRTDLFLIFDSAFDSKKNWVAESYSCYLAAGTKRPLIAKTKFNRNLFKDPGSNVLLHEKNIYLMLHEITHTLGFSSGLYKYFLDANGRTRKGHILSRSTALGTARVLNVPPLTSRLRKFFGCSSLAGAYMENTGSSATAGSHLERRMFPFEAMTSGLIYQQSMSEFTLALLEGTGWYIPNYSYADPYWFGQGEGCGFLTTRCSTANSRYSDFCTGSARSCTVVGRGGGKCGSDTRSDGCRFIRPNVNYDCENPSARNYARLPGLQSFGRNANSKCFSGTLSSTSSSSSSTSFCFKYRCSGSGSSTRLYVTVGSRSISCSRAGRVSVSGYRGHINCPDPRAFCATVGKPACPRGCMGRGRCSSGKCVCYKGFKGKDCGENI